MKIVFIVDYYYPAIGGAETLYQKLAEGLARHHQVVVLTQGKRYEPLYEVINQVKVFRVRTWHRALFPWQGFALAKKLVQDATIIQTATYSGGVLAARLRPFTQAKILCIVHEYLAKRWLDFGIYGLQAFCYEHYFFQHHFDHYIAVSESGKRQLKTLGIDELRITRIYNGVDTALFQPQALNVAIRKKIGISDSSFVFLFAGRPAVQKGVFILLEAIHQLVQKSSLSIDMKVKNILFVLLLGREPAGQRRRVPAFIKKNGLEHFVLVLDSVPRSELPGYIAMANTVIIPSLSEGFGFFAAEVAAMEVPLVVSAIDSLPEVVSGKVILIDSLSVDAIVQVLLQAKDGKFSVIEKKTFDWTETIQAYDKLYQLIS